MNMFLSFSARCRRCHRLRGRRRGEHHHLRRHRRVPREGATAYAAAAGAVAAQVRLGGGGGGERRLVAQLRVTPVRRHRCLDRGSGRITPSVGQHAVTANTEKVGKRMYSMSFHFLIVEPY